MPANRLLLITLTCLVALSGCGKSPQEKAIEKSIEASTGSPASVKMSENGIEIKTSKGEIKAASGGDVEIPAGFPKDIYVYKGAKVLSSMTMPGGQMLTLETADPLARVAEAYQKEMTGAGWKQEMAMDNGDSRMYSYAMDKQRAQVTLNADSDNAHTTITLMAGSEE
jgi:hypothetical protein